MRHPMRVLALACALTFTPACASLQLGSTRLENPISAAQTIDQRAYALLHAYAAIVEEATDIVADPATPLAFKRALGQAERAATPAAETLQIAVTGYMRARAEFDAASSANQTTIQRTATALSVAARRLNEAVTAAQAPIAELEGLIRARRGERRHTDVEPIAAIAASARRALGFLAVGAGRASCPRGGNPRSGRQGACGGRLGGDECR